MAEERVDTEPVVQRRGENEGQGVREPHRHAQQQGAEEQDIHTSAKAAHQEIAQELDRERRMRHIVAHNAIEGAEAVLHTNLLALLIRPASVGDPHLIDAQPQPCDLGNELRFEAKPLLLEINLLQHLTAEDLVAALHVCEVEVGEHVREQRQEPVANGMPKVEYAVRISREKAGADDHIRAARHKRLEEALEIAGIVFKVGVLDGNEVTGRLREPRVECRPLALVHLVSEDAYLRVLEREFLRTLEGTVRRGVINDKDL